MFCIQKISGMEAPKLQFQDRGLTDEHGEIGEIFAALGGYRFTGEFIINGGDFPRLDCQRAMGSRVPVVVSDALCRS